jgi:hypothetical protein
MFPSLPAPKDNDSIDLDIAEHSGLACTLRLSAMKRDRTDRQVA